MPQAHVDATAGDAACRAGASKAPHWDLSGLCGVFFGFTNKIIFFLKPLAAPKRESFYATSFLEVHKNVTALKAIKPPPAKENKI